MNKESIIETKECKMCHSYFNITDKDMLFYEKASPAFNGKKYLIPVPTFCPDCRLQRRLSFRNERSLYKTESSLTGETIISMYSPDKGFDVYEQEKWWSDVWNPLDYGQEFDFSRSFFEQFAEIAKKTPKPSMLTSSNENSSYTNYCSYLKDCYLLFDAANCVQSHYGYNVGASNHSVDSNIISQCENIYECVDCMSCYNLFFSKNCNDCRDSYFLENCSGCSNCIGCCNLTNKQYHVDNVFVGEEGYSKALAEIKSDINGHRKIYSEKFKNYPKKHAFLVQTDNVFGNSMISSSNCYSCYDGIYCQDCKYCSNGSDMKDTYDCESVGIGTSLSYELNASMRADRVLFSFGSWGSDLIYCDTCTGSYLFGCVGVHNNENYCILNKQYTKKEYETLVPKIIEHMKKTGEWGEYFPSSISPFGYNETVACEFFPLEKDEALKKGFKWSDHENPKPDVKMVIPAHKLPESISDIPDDILNWAIECEKTGKLFRIIKPELDFYRKHSIPIPKRHPDQRHLDRMGLRNPRRLYERNCNRCSDKMLTTYAPERTEIIYCENCFGKETF